MNILLIIEGTYPWYRGGVSEWVYQYLTNRSDFSFSILQIATDTFLHQDPDDALYPVPENVVNFVRIPPPEIEGDWELCFQEWFRNNLSVIEPVLKDQDVIHIANTGFAGWLGVELKERRDIPLVLTEHAIYWLEVDMGAFALECGYKVPEDSNGKEGVVVAFKEIAKKVYKTADQIISVSETNKPYQKALGAQSIDYIPNGIERNWIEDRRVKSGDPVFGWVGRCAEMKNPLQLFDYIDALRESGSKARFLVLMSDAGEESLAEEVKIKAESYPEMTLVWDQPSKEYYSEMDLLLITSHNESQPLVMLEALSKNVLPVGRQVGDFTDEFGLTFDKDKTEQEILINTMKLWNDRDSFSEYLEHRSRKIKERHTWDRIFDEYKIRFTELVNLSVENV